MTDSTVMFLLSTSILTSLPTYIFMQVYQTVDPCQTLDHVWVAGNQVKLVHGFLYSGSYVRAHSGSEPEIWRCMATARECMSNLTMRDMKYQHQAEACSSHILPTGHSVWN